jgi:hypothetical protein
LSAIYKASGLLITALVLIYAFQGCYPEFITFFSNAFSPVIAGVAVVFSGFSLQKYWSKLKERFSLIWICFTLGLFLWFIGEALWMGYTLIWNVDVPYPSIADAFWLSGYIPFFASLYFYVKIFSSVLSKKMLITSMLITAALSIIVSFTLITPVLGAEEDFLTASVDFAYPFLDVALFSISFLGLLIFINGGLGKPWLFVNIGIFANVVADILFSYTTAQEIYYAGHPLELLYHISYISFLLAFYTHTREL